MGMVGQGSWLPRIVRRAAGPVRRRPFAIAVVATAVLLAVGAGAWLDHERSRPDEPTALVVEPDAIERCGEPVTISADVSMAAGSRLTVRAVPTDPDLRSEDVQRIHVSRQMSRLHLQLSVGPGYSEDRDAAPPQELAPGTLVGTPVTPMVGEHVVTVEQGGQVIAKGLLTVQPENPDTPTTCHTSA